MRKALLQKRKYECQQCKNKHTKGHKVFKVKRFFVHQHHPILCMNRGQPPYIIDNLSSPWYSYHNSGGAVYVSDNFLMEN